MERWKEGVMADVCNGVFEGHTRYKVKGQIGWAKQKDDLPLTPG